MLFFLRFLSPAWGPLRMFGAHTVLLCLGALFAALFVWYGLPRRWDRLPHDHGKALVKDGAASAGKPTGAGYYLLWFTLPILVFFLPWTLPGIDTAKDLVEFGDTLREAARLGLWHHFASPQWGVVLCLFGAMYAGFLDDRSDKPWGRLKKGILDFAVAFAAALFLCRFQPMEIWLPLYKEPIVMAWGWYSLMATCILWFTINATNCSDGVDGLAGTLTTISLLGLAFFLYGVIGHQAIASYLLVPHNPEGARWAILCMVFAGATSGYLWHNANPSAVLMGDAGSRALGLLVGVAALATGNPFFILVIAPVLLVNGGTGLVKIVFLKVLARTGFDTGAKEGSHPCLLAKLLRSVRFPLHDHCKTALKWSNAQVLMRFTLLHAGLMPLLFVLLVKIR